MPFTEQWYPPPDARALVHFASRAGVVAGGFIELGSYEGRSALVLREAFPKRPILCVDAWPDDEVWTRFCQNTSGAQVQALRCSWEEFRESPDCWPRPVALVHVDMDHTYRQVSEQVAWARSVLEPGGVLVGHDYDRADWPEVVRAVDEHVPDRLVRAAVWSAP